MTPSGGRLAGTYDLGMLGVSAGVQAGFDALDVNWSVACDFAARYVNIALETDASFDPQAFRVQFSDSGSTLQSACELAPGSSDLFTCRIPESAALPAKLELTYFGKPFSTYNLDATLCSTNDHGKGPAQPGDGPDDEGPTGAQLPLDCTTPPFPAGCK